MDREPAQVVRFRNGSGPGQAIVLAMTVAASAFFILLWVRGMAGDGEPLPLLGYAAGALLFGFISLARLVAMRDRRVQVELSAEGLRDYRTGGVLVPWEAVRRITYAGGGNGSSSVLLDLTGPLHVGSEPLRGSGNTRADRIRVEITSLDVSPSAFIAHVRRLAPHADYRAPVPPWLG